MRQNALDGGIEAGFLCIVILGLAHETQSEVILELILRP